MSSAPVLGIGLILLIFSVALNLLTLTSPIFMMQVYDRVMTSHSVPTLVTLLSIVLALQVVQGILMLLRARLCKRLADQIDQRCEAAAFDAAVAPEAGGRSTPDAHALKHLFELRTFVAGAGLAAVMDLPWALVFALVMFLLHPWLGWLCLAFTVAIAGMSLAASVAQGPSAPDQGRASAICDAARDPSRGAAIRAMGLDAPFRAAWLDARAEARATASAAQTLTEALQSAVRILRLTQGSAMLALSAYLTLENMATFGVMMASSIIAGRVSAPVDGLIGSWRDVKAAHTAWPKLRAIMRTHDQRKPEGGRTAPPSESVVLQDLVVGPPGQIDGRSINGLSLALKAGDRVGVIGPSGAGKSTLINAIAGAWPLQSGRIRFDGVDRRRWNSRALASAIGYMPQEIIFFDGTVAENIARFDRDGDHQDVIDAAKSAGIHEVVEGFTQGYQTPVTNAGRSLPPGFKIKLALARAFYRQPFLLVLDNPTAHLDRHGEVMLAEALKRHAERGGILIMATSHATSLMLADKVAVLNAGKLASFGSREDLFRPTGARTEPAGSSSPAIAGTAAIGRV